MTSVINDIFEVLNNREKAILIWLLLMVILGALSSKFRRPILYLLKSFLSIKIMRAYCAMLLYLSLVVSLLYLINIWNISNLGDTIKWGILVAFLMLYNFEKAMKPNYFKAALLSNFKILVVLEFIVNLYVLSLPLEFLLAPFLAMLGVITAVAESEKQYESVNKLTNLIISFIGITFLAYSSYMVVTSFDKFCTVKTLENFYLPIVLSISFIPFVYIVALYSKYEIFFIRLGSFVKDPIVLKYAKRETLWKMNINLRKLEKWSKYINSNWRFKEKQEVDDAIFLFCNYHKRNM